MNILILTPDRVGSTLLQRVLTIHMNNMSSDRISSPVVNLHELTNGIENYHSDKFNMDMTGKSKRWGYYQTLHDITEILKNTTTHDITGRLTHYHLIRRDDSLPDQTNFYRYLNDNFFIISCQRNSVFEYALSWGIKGNTDKLNVYSHHEKIETFTNLYKNQISIPKKSFIKYLNAYKSYQNWVDTYFDVNEFFVYEEHMANIETFVDELSCFNNISIKSWHDIFGINWSDWNRCHRLLSDIGSVGSVKLLEYTKNTDLSLNTSKIVGHLPVAEQNFLDKHASSYLTSTHSIKELVDDKLLTGEIPIKLQTLIEKKMIIKNFNDCAIIYNEWAVENDYPIIKDTDEIINQAYNELKNWYEEIPSNFKLLK